MPSLKVLLEGINDDLITAQTLVGSAPGPLSQPARDQVQGKLTSAEGGMVGVVELYLDPGDILVSLPESLPGIAATCVTLSGEALAEALNSPPDGDYINDRMATITWLINTTDGYRERVGT